MKKFVLTAALCLLNLVFLISAEADEPEIDLDPIVVTPYRYSEVLSKTPSSVSVVTQADIENSNAEDVVDVLRGVPGVTVRDFYGNGAVASVDMAGFGEQAALNVLVLVDGRRINDVDLSGVDWSQIPLDQVERVEVIRGGSAGVLYGDNASSGVINIITKKGAGKPQIKLETEYGSYNKNKQKLTFQGSSKNKFSYFFNAGHDGSNGYRHNTFNKIEDFATRLEYDFNDVASVHFSSGYHDASYGLPSGLFQHHIDTYGRRWARYGEDYTKNKDFYFLAGPKIDLASAGRFDVDFSYRHKDADSFFLTSHNDTRKNKIDTIGVTPKYTLSSNILEHENKLVSGIDFYRVLYRSDNYPYTNDKTLNNYTNIQKDSIGVYLQDEFSLTHALSLVNGYRYEAARYAFAYHDFTGFNPDRDAKINPQMEAFNSGLVYNYQDDSSAFFNVGRTFRFPEVDEFTGMYDINFHQFLNTNLKPQSALNYEIGVRHKFTDRLKGSVSLFRMNVKNYIYYNPTGGAYGFGENENYDKTIHEGVESSLETKLSERILFFGNYTFTKAFFDGGVYNKNDIPFVPNHKASLGLRFLLPKDFTLNLAGTYVGKRYFINDQANAVSPLNGYMVADMNLSWRLKECVVTFAINNILDKQYSEYGVYGTDSSNGFVYDKCYFPSPERNFSLKVEYTF